MSKDEGGYRATALRSDRGARGVIGQGVLSTVTNYIGGGRRWLAIHGGGGDSKPQGVRFAKDTT